MAFDFKRVLITGGAGFIGSSLADRLLAAGKTVAVADNFSPYYDVRIKEENIRHNLNNPAYSCFRGDIEDPDFIKKVFTETRPDAVVHLAARAGVRPSLENPLSYVKTNVGGTANILEQMRTDGIKKLVFASSSSVYGSCAAELFSEDLRIDRPVSPYAATKAACEQMCYTWHVLYGLNVVCLRYFTVYGPRQRPDLAISKFARCIMKGEPVEMFGDGSSVRDYTYIDDIVTGTAAALDYDKTGYEIINLGGGEPVKLSRMIEVIEQNAGRTAVIRRMPFQPGDVERTACDFSKAARLLGYRPSTSFEDGIKKFIAWLKLNSGGIRS